jgi:signal transduction histidine kinase
MIPQLSNQPLSENLSIFWIPPKTVKEQNNEFTSTLLHEIRNPLTNIHLAIEVLKSTITDDSSRMYLDIIERGSMRINEQLTSLLVPTGNKDIQSEEYSIHQLLNEVLDIENDRLLLKNISVNRVYDQKGYKTILNKQGIKIALTNIIINAIEAMPSENGQLTLITRDEGDDYIVEIEDNGAGISKENLACIFEPYFTTKPGGLGIGLSTTLDILFSNHVKVNVRSKEGKGTQFVLFFTARGKYQALSSIQETPRDKEE